MTTIQSKSLPEILQGKDVIGKGKTGSGKTAAFGLGVINQLNVERFRVQALVLCPTRELADQVAKEMRRLARAIHNIKILTLCGGMPFGPQINSLEHGAHIIVGTPGRVLEHLNKERLKLNHLTMLVLDEADRMLDMGFQASLDEIMEFAPSKRQTLLFSATYPNEIDQIAKRVMHAPVKIEVAATHSHTSIQQHFYLLEETTRFEALLRLLAFHQPESSVVFCNTKRESQEVADKLTEQGFVALALHGDMEQKKRDESLVRFANKSLSILVATDVAARGLDIEELDMVVNYHMTRDSEVHVHRIGRTGRAGNQGIACTLLEEKEHYKIKQLEEYLDTDIHFSSALPPVPSSFKPTSPTMVTLQIDGGKKQKVRPGDILGALTGDGKLKADCVGKINVFDFCTYVAITRKQSKYALNKLSNDKIKGRSFRARLLRR